MTSGAPSGALRAADTTVEETREMLGLLIVTAWMALLVWRRRRRPLGPESQPWRSDP